MAELGRPRKPTSVKEAQGTARPSRMTDEPQWREGSVEPPDWLFGEARTEWNRLVPDLIEQGLFPVTAYSEVAAGCEAWGLYRKAVDVLRDNGEVVETASGYPVPSPWLATRSKALGEYLTVCGHFGANPSSASKVTARPKNTQDDELSKAREARRANR